MTVVSAPHRHLFLPEALLSPRYQPENITSIGRAHRRDWVLADATAVVADCAALNIQEDRHIVNYAQKPVVPGDTEVDMESSFERRIFEDTLSN